jgi:hypothetical protein
MLLLFCAVSKEFTVYDNKWRKENAYFEARGGEKPNDGKIT